MPSSMKTALLLSAALLPLPTMGFAAERPTFNHTCDPRPDILPHPFYASRTEYRREYNRPRYWSGWLAHKIAPTSQEAMVWCENNRAGAYNEKHAPPRYKRYFAPKPWEALQTGARPDFADVKPLSLPPLKSQSPARGHSPEVSPGAESKPPLVPAPSVLVPEEAASPSDARRTNG